LRELKRVLHLLARSLLLLAATIARAATSPEPAEAPFTAKELAQGFRDRVIIARPHAARRAQADTEEASACGRSSRVSGSCA
jgi:hypothetical protein